MCSLHQWVAPNKTCPTCRKKCPVKEVLKLFINGSDPLFSANLEDISSEEMKEQLSMQDSLLKQKDKALQDAKASLEEVQEHMKAWEAQFTSTDKKLRAERATSSTLKKQLTVMQHECDRAKSIQKEADKMKTELSTVRGINAVLKGSSEEVEELLKNYSASQLATFVTAIKGDYDVLKQKKKALQKEKDGLAQDVIVLKTQLRGKDCELKDCQERLSTAESDVRHFEQENRNLREKVEILCKAAESPGSKLALKRMLESPAPLKEHGYCNQMVGSDIGASPLLASRTKSKSRIDASQASTSDVEVEMAGSKRSRNEHSGIVFPVKKFRGLSTSENIASGFNGMGGQTKFIMPKPKVPKKPSFASSRLISKPFAPRKAPLNQPKIRF
ncbi:E3 ubiquitin-protein ligase TRAIP-like isoform X2 [Halichondria panicea]|uniref:E3 ubiquitin-protein ligase TRAIP-like isoform X2 n=1 Tax=Halichondria panicea TaxID=6063 RepID=UPI00312B9C1E